MKQQENGDIQWTDVPALILFCLLAAIVLLQFLSRYVLNDSVAWTEEIARYLLIGVAYFGSLTALRRGGHIFLEVIYRHLTGPNVKALALLTDAASLVFNATLTVLCLQLALVADRRMISVDLPKSIVYGAVAMALLAATLISLHNLRQRAQMGAEEIRQAIEDAAAGEDAT
ncbi:MAG: TRAP transporter small permease [Woeseiaceae bacterium]